MSPTMGTCEAADTTIRVSGSEFQITVIRVLQWSCVATNRHVGEPGGG